MLVFVPFAKKGVSQILDPMEVFPPKRPLRKVMRLLKVTSLKKWKKPLKNCCRRTPQEAPTSLSQIQKQKELN